MSSSLLTKTLILLFFINCWTFYAQTSDTLEIKTKESKTHLNVEFSGIVPIAFGDNFAADGMDFKYGLNFSFKGYFTDHLFFGLKFQHLRADVADQTLVGVFEHSNVNSYLAVGGYRFVLDEQFNIEPSLGIGATVYNNKKTTTTFDEKIDFEDDATTLIFSAAASYQITEQLKVFIKPEYRIDFMQIDTAPIRQDFFDEAHFLNILFGIRFGY
ncbi:outer membrane beta-barrel protein [Flavobacteriaceae bacterium 14752]|uniref:outer membrane beta-barrel protein n=1 Tax=Mesohalobacter salilacus TaxID=2491711 RepID=UPI000F62C870|nr:DUF3575 domain-containing protein [Flavobacteriaceae bacterium 14752]